MPIWHAGRRAAWQSRQQGSLGSLGSRAGVGAPPAPEPYICRDKASAAKQNAVSTPQPRHPLPRPSPPAAGGPRPTLAQTSPLPTLTLCVISRVLRNAHCTLTCLGTLPNSHTNAPCLGTLWCICVCAARCQAKRSKFCACVREIVVYCYSFNR